MPIRQSTACRRLSAMGIPQVQVHDILNTVEKWVRCSGEEWTVERLKNLKTAYLQILSGTKPDAKWIATYWDGTPKGPFSALMRGRSRKAIAKGLNALMVYSSFVAPRVTAKQWKKFSTSVISPPPADPKCIDSLTTSDTGLPTFIGEAVPASFQDITLGESKVPMWRGKCSERQIADWLPDQVNRPIIYKLVATYPEPFSGIRTHLEHATKDPETRNRMAYLAKEVNTVGRIGFIQEAGYKLRAVANPNRVIQVALEPLQRSIWQLLARIPQDCTFDQQKGVSQVGRWLSEGRRVFSVDLSDATNNFPLSMQVQLLRKVFPDQSWRPYIDLFERVSRESWECTGLIGERMSISWTKGQPLGLGPSFGAFALAHHQVLRCCLMSNARRESNSGYVLLGDDIAITGEDTYKMYRKVLTELGCPVSESKTISSVKLAEFAGRVVIPGDSIPTFKWRNPNDRSFLDIAKALGPKAIALFTKRQREVISLLADIPSPDIYDVGLQGLGWNPYGIPLQERIYFANNVSRIVGSRGEGTVLHIATQNMDLALRMGSKVKLSPQTYYHASVPRPEEHVKKKGESVYQRILSILQPLSEAVPKEAEVRSLGYKPSHKVSDPRGLTTLDHYEQVLSSLLPLRTVPKESSPGLKIPGTRSSAVDENRGI